MQIFFSKYYRSLAEAVQMFRDVASTVGKLFIFKFRGSDSHLEVQISI